MNPKLSNYSDKQLQEELLLRAVNRQVDADAPLIYSDSRGLICKQLHGRQDSDGTEVEMYYVQNGGWEGSRCGDWFIAHAPQGDNMSLVEDWEELVTVYIRNEFATKEKMKEVEQCTMDNEITLYDNSFDKVQLRAIDATMFKLKWG